MPEDDALIGQNEVDVRNESRRAENQTEALEVERHQERKHLLRACLKPIGRNYCFRRAGHAGPCEPF